MAEGPTARIFMAFNLKATSWELVAKWAALALCHQCSRLDRVEFFKVGLSFKQPRDFVSVQRSSQQWETCPPGAHIPAKEDKLE